MKRDICCTIVVSSFFVLALLSAVVAPASAAAVNNDTCLGCHGSRDITEQSGERMFVDPAKFAATSHAVIGCDSCHTAVTASHPNDGSKPAKAVCKECHAPVHAEYATALHSSKASCNDCHNPHEVKPALLDSGESINRKCAKCHDPATMVKTHAVWLPQADLHIEALPCITCHTGSKNYVITMTIQNRKGGDKLADFKSAGYDELAALNPADGDIKRLVDADGDGAITLKELRNFNIDLRGRGMRLWGMMMPEVVTHTYQILENRWDCSFCHASGPKAMQTSYVAFPEKNGRVTRLPVENGAVMDLLYGTPDFYMMGSTRSTALNIVGGLIVLGGMMMPIGHGTLRFLTRKNRKGQGH